MNDWVRHTVEIEGLVQGVGFRPTVFRLARDAGLGGFVQNRSGGVRLCLIGPRQRVAGFLERLPASLPPRARIDRIATLEWGTVAASDVGGRFRILESEEQPEAVPDVPPDIGLCAKCRQEVLDPRNRRHGYPFTTCCDCGPRYTVIESTPYDRERTTMRVFPLCPDCRAEYEDPASRRFHAESIACPACGPALSVHSPDGRPINGPALRVARAALAEGRIVALRGIGGFLLAVNALDPAAVRRLRERKRRPHKPFATMAADLEVARRHFVLDPDIALELSSPAAPIAILHPRPESPLPVDAIAPDQRTIGVMLPTSALHLLLALPLPGDPTPPFDILVMTSGNRSGAPICLANDEALAELGAVADVFLFHNRDICLRADDSLFAVRSGRPQIWRRARGYAPSPLRLARPLRRAVLALGAELKNTLAVGFADRIWLSPHIGDLAAPEAVAHLRKVAARLPADLRLRPEVVAVDLHPDYRSTQLGLEIAGRLGLPLVRVQHHHAHAAALLAEHHLECGLVLAWDGTGLGTDGHIWGAELLHLPRLDRSERLASFRPVPLPGGDAAVLRPARQLVGRWHSAGLPLEADACVAAGISFAEAELWLRQIECNIAAPLTHAAGRLFDAVAVALGAAPDRITYEGQTAVRLETLASAGRSDPELAASLFGLEKAEGMLWIDWTPTFLLLRRSPSAAPADFARTFHTALVMAALAMARHGRQRTGASVVGLSGGVFMNRILHEEVCERLAAEGFQPLVHSAIPPNDGGVSLGQAVVAGGSE